MAETPTKLLPETAQMLRCKRCHEPLHIFVEIGALWVGCAYRGCPLTHLGSVKDGLAASAILAAALPVQPAPAPGGGR